MLGGVEGERRGPRVDRVAGLVLAMIAGALLPVGVVAALAARDPLPRDCRSGQATATTVEGALLFTTGPDLWYSEGYPGRPRKLVDYSPVRPRRGVSPSPSGSPAPPSPSPSSSATAAAAPASHLPQVVAADISVDRKLVAFLVTDPPGHAGSISLVLASPLDAPGTAPVAPWVATADRGSRRPPMVRILDNGKVLFWAPVAPGSLPLPSPLASPAPSHTATPSAGTPVPGSGSATSPTPTPAIAVVVVAPGPSPAVSAQAPESYFLADGHSAWADTRAYRLPPAQPRLRDRVDGPGNRVAGREGRDVGTPLASRHLNQIVLGRAGQPGTTALCAAAAGVVPTGFSPDDAQLVLSDGSDSLLLDLSGTHAATRLLGGQLLAWR